MVAARGVFALDLQNIRFGEHPGKTRMVVELDRKVDFRLFVLPDPYRMVLDLPSFSWKAGKPDAPNGMSAIRHGNLKPGISRVVFDLSRPMAVQNAFFIDGDRHNPDRLVVDFVDTNVGGFAVAQRDVRGDLNVDNPQAPNYSRPYKTASLNAVAAPAPAPAPTQKESHVKPMIIIDPGHGGVDPGAIGANGVHEKKVVLALAHELKKQLLDTGRYRVEMTRQDDRFIKLSDRVKFARQYKGDLFVSLHADSIGNSNVSGASFYTLSEKASDAQAAKLAARENKADLIAGIELEVEDAVVMDILIDLARRNTQNQSKYFAKILIDDFNGSGLKTLQSANRHANFAVLKAHDIPSVLVETGFMSNRSEADRLNTPAHRSKMAKALRKGIDAYFKTVKENERS